MTDLSYPIGKFKAAGELAPARREELIAQIAATPDRLAAAVAGLDDAQLDTPYRPEGWTVRQVVHHVPDSHLNAYVRLKLALTEERPTIRPYDQERWSKLPDASAPVAGSLALLRALHERWVLLLRSVEPGEWSRTFIHPEHGRELSLDWLLDLYAWHGRHHTAHVTALRERLGWG